MADETKKVQIQKTFFEDDEATIHFFYTSKDSVIGLAHPDNTFTNDASHTYVRVAFYKFYTEDSVTITNINETLDITLIPTEPNAKAGIDSCNFKIAFSAHGQGMRVLPNSVKATVIYNINLDLEDIVEERVIITEDPYKNEQNMTCYGVGIWVYIPNMKYVCTNVDRSISVNSMPIDIDSHPSPYIGEYLNDSNKVPDVNMYRLKTYLESRIITYGEDANTSTNKKIVDIEEKLKHEPHLYTQNTALYNPIYYPESAGMEFYIETSGIRGPVLDRIIEEYPDEKAFRVKQPGIYALQLKNGFYLIQGNSRVDLNVYINDEQIKEMRICSYLQSNLHSENLLIDPYRLGDEYYTYKGELTRDEIDPYGGMCAVKLSPTENDNYFAADPNTNRPIKTTGQTYKASVWLKASVECSINLSLNNTLGHIKNISVGKEWRQYTAMTTVNSISSSPQFMIGGLGSLAPIVDGDIYIYNPVVDLVDDAKTVKNTYSSNTYITKLTPDDIVRLGVAFMNIDNLVLENETMLSVTALQYNV